MDYNAAAAAAKSQVMVVGDWEFEWFNRLNGTLFRVGFGYLGGGSLGLLWWSSKNTKFSVKWEREKRSGAQDSA